MTTAQPFPKVKPLTSRVVFFTLEARRNLKRFTRARQRKTDMVDTLLCKQ